VGDHVRVRVSPPAPYLLNP